MDGSRRIGRRAVVTSMVMGATAGLAGCLDGEPGPGDFAYPEGFAVDGIDLEAALGPTSAMASLEALELETAHEMHAPMGILREHREGRFDRSAGTFLADRRRIDEMRGRVLVSTRFFDGTEVIERRRVEPRAIDWEYRASEHAFDPIEDTRLGAVRSIIDSVDLTASEVHTDGAVDRVVYAGDEADIPAKSRIGELADSMGALERGSVRLEADDRGLFHDVTVGGTVATGEESTLEFTMRWTYGSFDDIDVQRPDWLSEVPDRERPEVDLRIEEDEGRHVAVHIDRLEHAVQVLVVVDGEGVVDVADAPGVITVPAETYTDASGSVRDVLVFVADRLRGPQRVDTHVPTPVDR